MKKTLFSFLTAVLLALATSAHAGLTFSDLHYEDAGSERKVTGTVTFDSSYANNGESVSPAALGLTDISTFQAQATSGYIFQYNYTSDLLLVYNGAGFTPAGSFTGTAVDVAQTVTVTHDGTPDGNPIYLKYGANGPYLACNIATDTVDKVIAFTDGGKLVLKHDASASSGNGAVQVYFDSDGVGASRLLAVDAGAAQVYLQLSDGAVLQVLHDASAATNGNAITYDDGSDERLESNNTTAANATLSTVARTWSMGAPAGSFTGTPVAEGALSQVDASTNLATLTANFVAYGNP